MIKFKQRPNNPSNKHLPKQHPSLHLPPLNQIKQHNKQKKKSSSSSSSSSSVKNKPKTTQPPKTNVGSTKAQVIPPKVNGTNKPPQQAKKESSSGSSSDDDEPKKPVTQTGAKNVSAQSNVKSTPTTTPGVVKGKKSSSSSSSSEEKNVKGKGKPTPTANKVIEKPVTQTTVPKGGKAKKESSSSGSSSSEVKGLKPTEKKAPQAQGKTGSKTEKNKTTKKDKEESSSDSSSSEMHIDLKSKSNDVKMTDADQKGIKRKRDSDEPTNAKKRKMNNGEGEATGNLKVRVGNLSFELDGYGEDIKKHFEDCGEVKSIEMITRKDGKWAGVAILEFADEDSANNALKKNNEDFYGRKMAVSFSTDRAGGGAKKGFQTSEKPEGCTTIFIGNLSFNITEDQVFEFFQDCGDIKECRWPKGDFTGIGWVEFYDTNATDLAIKKAGEMVMGREIRVDYAAPRKSNF
jgi:nucleolin